MMRRIRFAVGAIAAAALLPAATAQATITVTNTNDSGAGSLRQAIVDAAPGETIILPAGTYTLTSGELVVNKSLVIDGADAATTIVRSDGGARVFNVSGAGNDVTLTEITIRNGLVAAPGGIALGGGIVKSAADLTLEDVVVTQNAANASGGPGGGGGIAEGGGIFSSGGTLVLLGSRVSGNAASAVGGSGDSGGIAQGGGVFASTLRLERTTAAANLADARGGQGPSNPSQDGGIAQGGGIFFVTNSPPASRWTEFTFNENTASASAGPGGGAGIAQGGGAFVITNGPPVSLSNGTVTGSVAQAVGGGGIASGGGVFASANNPGTIALTGLTLSANAIEGGGPHGGNLTTNDRTTIENTIVSGGSGPAGGENCGMTATSRGHNLDSLNQCGFTAPGDLRNTDPLLGPLQDNGGPTRTMGLPAQSPAVDRGASAGLASDQRGILRPIDFPAIDNSSAAGSDGADIGAFELQPESAIKLGKVKRNEEKGTAKVRVKLPQPAAGKVKLKGKGVKRKTKKIRKKPKLKLPVKPKAKVKQALEEQGAKKVRIKVIYKPTGNERAKKRKKVKLVLAG